MNAFTSDVGPCDGLIIFDSQNQKTYDWAVGTFAKRANGQHETSFGGYTPIN